MLDVDGLVAAWHRPLVFAITLTACGPASSSVGDDTDGAVDSTTAAMTPMSDSDSDSNGADVDSSSGGPLDDGSSSGEPRCGDNVVDPGEACDDESTSCQDDCTFTCDIARAFTIPPGPTGTADFGIARPVALPDGSGFLIPDTRSVLRYARDGELVWRRTEPLAPWVYSVLPSALSPDHFWMSSVTEDGVAALGLFEVSTGQSVDVATFPQTGAAGSLVYDGAGNLVQMLFASTGDQQAIIRSLDDQGAEVWRTEVAREPIGDVEALVSAAVADDGSLYLSGSNGTAGAYTTRSWVVMLAPDGTVQWERLVFEDDPVLEDFYYGSAAVTALGSDAVVVARHQRDEVPYLGSTPYFETRVLRLDPEGEVVWEQDLSDQATGGRIELTTAITLSDDRVAVAGALDSDGDAVGWFGIIDGQGTLQCQATTDGDAVLETKIVDLFRDLDGRIGMLGTISTESSVPFYVNERFMAFAGSE